ncbi:MAG: cytochrome [Blastopirellula sp.]|nr:MAG: cytochrome [Blastopirellula sp.]
MVNPVPVVKDVVFQNLLDDPYPSYDRIRNLASAVWVDSARINLVTRFDDIMEVERNHAVFASTNPKSLMNKVMGHSLMRKDDELHQIERKALEPSFRPGVVKKHWGPIFSDIADRLISAFEDKGEADLFKDFAGPMASYALIELLGFKSDVAWQDISLWSQSLMDAVGNYSTDPGITARGKAAAGAIETEIDRVLGYHTENENPSILSSIAHAEHKHSIEQIRANVNVVVGGGLNEPRDSILTLIYGLLLNPNQLARVQKEKRLFATAFEEAVRWVSPIGMYPRRVTQDTVLGDTQLKEGDQIGICIGAANRDPSHFDDPSVFDINRPRQQHLAFGGGPHFCAGTWVAKQMVGEIAVPMIFDRLKNLRLHGSRPVIENGWVFRGPTSLPVQWDV